METSKRHMEQCLGCREGMWDNFDAHLSHMSKGWGTGAGGERGRAHPFEISPPPPPPPPVVCLFCLFILFNHGVKACFQLKVQSIHKYQ